MGMHGTTREALVGIVRRAVCTTTIGIMALVGMTACGSGSAGSTAGVSRYDTAQHDSVSKPDIPSVSKQANAQHDNRKAAATRLYDELLDTRTLYDALVIAVRIIPTMADSQSIADTVPECKTLPSTEVAQVIKELKPLSDEAAAHINSLPQ